MTDDAEIIERMADELGKELDLRRPEMLCAAILAVAKPHIVAAERDRCATIADQYDWRNLQSRDTARNIAAAIRVEPSTLEAK